MGFFSSFFGSNKVEATPSQVATAALQAAFSLALEGESSAHQLLQSAGVAVTNDNEYQVELIIYELFLLDVALNRALGRDGRKVREQLRQQFADAMGQFLTDSGLDPGPERERIGIIEKRFEEYTPALRRSMESEGQSERGSLALPEVACRNILRTEEPDLVAKLALAGQWPTVLEEFGESFQEYEIIPSS